jgi:hypothetical protein
MSEPTLLMPATSSAVQGESEDSRAATHTDTMVPPAKSYPHLPTEI